LKKKYKPFVLVFTTFAFLLLFSILPTGFTLFGFSIKQINILSDLIKKNNAVANSEIPFYDSTFIKDLNINQISILTFNLNLDSLLEKEKKDLRITSYAGNNIFLKRFFPSLENKKKPIRVAYFGDSMIEGDLISQTLRNEMQKHFGGMGVGFVPITSIVSNFRRSIIHEFSDDWKEFSIQKTKDLKNFAPSGYVYNPKTLSHGELHDTTKKHIVSYVLYKAPGKEHETLNKFYTTKLYYGIPPEGTYIKYYIDGKECKTLLKGASLVNELVLNNHIAYKELRIEFFTDSIFDVYGVSLESTTGTFVDNYAVRGNMGMALQKIPEEIITGFNNYMDYSLLIFQFGLNVASPEAKHFGWYENAMVNVVEYYKKLMPNADVLIISIGDKSAKYEMEYITQPGIPKLVEAQRNIAKRTQSHFWNLYQSMGGYNSMKAWVETPQPLASKDYAHINFKGAEKISKLLLENFLNEFHLFKYNENKVQEKEQTGEALKKSKMWLFDELCRFDKQWHFINSKCAYKDDKKTMKPDVVLSCLTGKKETVPESNTYFCTDTSNYEFRVHIATSNKQFDLLKYKNILKKHQDKQFISIKHSDGYYRLYIAPFLNLETAENFASILTENKQDAYVVSFLNNNRTPFEKAKQKYTEAKTEAEELPVFRVQFCASEVELDVSFYQNVIDHFGKEKIIMLKDEIGMMRYMLGNYNTYKEAETALKQIFELNQDGYITAYYKNKRIKTDEALTILNKK